ncbi:Uncharacterised protein [Escherichia coli]|nr:Uncharacterised protein [Escherichia coli]
MKLIFQHGDGRLLPVGDVVRPVQRGAQAGVFMLRQKQPRHRQVITTQPAQSSVLTWFPPLKTLTAGRTYQPEEHRRHEVNQRS